MPISRGGKLKTKVARTMRGRCGICYKPVISGEAYETCVGGTNSENGYLAHYNCYKPSGAPTYEELQARNKGVKCLR